jgi:hypothetical protein
MASFRVSNFNLVQDPAFINNMVSFPYLFLFLLFLDYNQIFILGLLFFYIACVLDPDSVGSSVADPEVYPGSDFFLS